MNQKRIVIIITVVILIVVGIGLFFFFQSSLKNKADEQMPGGKGGDSIFFGSSERGTAQGEMGEDGAKETVEAPSLQQISSIPSSGTVALKREDDSIVVRYVERATGHIYEKVFGAVEQKRLSNTTIPRTEEVLWSPDGESVIMRYLDENEILRSFYGTISEEKGVLVGWFLNNNIQESAVSAEGKLFSLEESGDFIKGTRSNFDGTDKVSVFTSTVRDWKAAWGGSEVFVQTKTSNGIFGYLYRLSSGRLDKIVSAPGLDALLSPSRSRVLFSTSDGGGTSLFVYDIAKGTSVEVPFRTFAEKCVWSSEDLFYCASPYSAERTAEYPDDWYKGLAPFSDDIWSFDMEKEVAQLVYDMEKEGLSLDIIDLKIIENAFLLFRDKNELTLWGLSLN